MLTEINSINNDFWGNLILFGDENGSPCFWGKKELIKCLTPEVTEVIIGMNLYVYNKNFETDYQEVRVKKVNDDIKEAYDAFLSDLDSIDDIFLKEYNDKHNYGGNRMSNIKALLDELKTREKDIFPKGFAKSGLTAKDITEIGKELKIKFPASFKTFLRTYQIPSAKVYITLCGEYADAFGVTFSRSENKYIDTEEDEVLVEVDWAGYDVSSVDSFIKSYHDINDGTSAWAKAGYFYLGEFRGYQIFLDGKEDVVYLIYHEDLFESEDYEDPKAARECMEENGYEFCDNFEQLLKVICTGKTYDESEHILYGDEPVEEQPKDTAADLTSCILKVGEASDTPIKNQDKIGGFPTYLPDKIPEASNYGGHFFMEIYNHGFADPEIICWQFYSQKFACYISDVIEIRKGAKLYDESSKLIKKRRWFHEFPLILEPADPKKLDGTVSAIGGKIPKLAKNAFKRKKIIYLGCITEKITPTKELYISGYNEDGVLAFGFDAKGALYAETYE